MAIVTVTGENRTLQDQEAITGYLASIGIDYDRWDSLREIASNALRGDPCCLLARD